MGQSQVCVADVRGDGDREFLAHDPKAWSPVSACCTDEINLGKSTILRKPGEAGGREVLGFDSTPWASAVACCAQEGNLGASTIIARGGYQKVQDGEEEEDLLNEASFVKEFALDPAVVDAAVSSGPSPDSEAVEVLAAPTGFLELDIPEDFEDGMVVVADCECGQVEVRPHPNEAPGSHIRIPLRPHPEFQIEVPFGKKGGDTVHFKREDGTSVFVVLPEELNPGDTFYGTTPCLMVRVPAAIQPGAAVVFSVQDFQVEGKTQWWQAKVPPAESWRLGQFFFARLPVDPRAEEP